VQTNAAQHGHSFDVPSATIILRDLSGALQLRSLRLIVRYRILALFGGTCRKRGPWLLPSRKYKPKCRPPHVRSPKFGSSRPLSSSQTWHGSAVVFRIIWRSVSELFVVMSLHARAERNVRRSSKCCDGQVSDDPAISARSMRLKSKNCLKNDGRLPALSSRTSNSFRK
jgi:hypothetical protein